MQAPDPAPQHELHSPWGRVHSRFLASLDHDERLRIFDLSARIATALQHWAERHPLIRTARIPALALSVAAGAPFSSVEALVSTARLSLWVFTLDDWFDEESAPEPKLHQHAQDFRSLAYQQRGCPTNNSLAMPLSEVVEDLASYPLFDVIGTRWADAISGTIDGMLRENEWRAALRKNSGGDWTSLPGYDEYVAIGRYSIGGPPHMWAAMITAGDPSTPDHLDHLASMERLASTCIRLANDLQSYYKEILEGKINGLVILSRGLMERGEAPEVALSQARQRISADITAGLYQLSLLRATAVTRSGHPEAAMDNIARFVCDFYAHHDYHTFVDQTA